ncbi:MAG: acyl-[acyl-carrier-protein]--UDP-N-acetylglucosamine O-acyltransferase, partial [SAR324 cluster bacterium]|nr:acyl-[acyl-carrier-protein]--UDP-N-acetylglucosamine O-acyltransferase [SAR324 cluster bacterium]
SKVTQDIPPYVIADGNPLRPRGINKIGLERNGVPAEESVRIQQAYKIFYRSQLTAQEAIARLKEELGESPAVRKFIEFVSNSQRGVCR